MSSEVYKKRRQPSKTGGCLSFFAVVADKSKSTPQGVKKKETPRGKTATLPYEKMPLRTKKVLTYTGKYGMILSEKFESPKVF